MHVLLISLLLGRCFLMGISKAQSDKASSGHIVFVILSQPNKYHARLAEQRNEDLLKQAKDNNMHPPVIHMTAHDWPEVMGSWTVFPLLSRLSNIHKHNSSWILFCEDITSVDLEKLVALLEKYNSSKPYFIGHGLMDNEPTIIHHFDTVERNSPFLYPAFNTGFVISTSLLKKLSV